LGIGALHSEREWPDEYWVKFLAKLRHHSAGTLSFVGGDDYTQRAQTLVAQAQLREAIDACSLGLVEAVALLHHADLFIGTDSGLMNLAVAVATPAFALFGVNTVLSYSK
jgi:ADP-heptose:LPS heptosyltransferase